MTCKKAQGFLEKNVIEVEQVQDASKQKQGPREALALARSASKVIAAKGKKIVTFDMKNNPPDDDTLLAHLLGPSGNLRAPTLRKGNMLLVGFDEKTYKTVLAGR